MRTGEQTTPAHRWKRLDHVLSSNCQEGVVVVRYLGLTATLIHFSTFVQKHISRAPDHASMNDPTGGPVMYDIVEYMPQGLMYPNEEVKAAVCYLYGKLYSSSTAAQILSAHFSDNLCGAFLATLESAQTKELQINCMGFLKQLLKYEHFVTVIMNESGCHSDSESTPTLQAQNPLPLVLKKILLTKEELLQIASAQCITAILVHSPTKYAPAFIHADIPEFLFEHLSSTNEVLIWSIYCCLLLMTEERLFFSKCHTVYGIEAVIRSLKDVLLMNNRELHKQGLLLLTEILERQPIEIKLFTNPGIFKAVTNVLLEAVNFPILDVAIEATKCASAFLRISHLTTPVQYCELQKLISAIIERCADLPLPPMNRRQVEKYNTNLHKKEAARVHIENGYLLRMHVQEVLNLIQIALFDSGGEEGINENAFTAPMSESEDTLKRFSCFLLQICDSICIPTVMKYYERSPVPAAMEIFYSLLCDMFAVVPNMKKTFCIKLASASFIRLALEVKSTLCSGHRQVKLTKQSYLRTQLVISLGLTLEKASPSIQCLWKQVADMLQKSVINLSGNIPESLSLLLETPNSRKDLRFQQHSLIVIFCVAFMMEDSMCSKADLFWAVLGFLHSVQCHGDHTSLYVIRAALYLLAICQDECTLLPTTSLSGIWLLNLTSINMICRILEDAADIQMLYFHHPLYLKFFFRYPKLRESYGCKITKLWMTYEDNTSQMCDEDRLSEDCKNNQCCFLPLLNILHSDPNSLLVFLDLIVSGPLELSHKVLLILKIFLKENESSFVSGLFASRLLQVLQRILMQSTNVGLQDKNLPLILSLLYLVQLKSNSEHVMDNINFKFLFHVCNLSGKCTPSNVEVLQPAFNFLYCSLHLSETNCKMRATAMLLSNIPLIELIEKILEFLWDTSSTSDDEFQTLCSSACLITSSLACFQQTYNLKVHKSFCLDFDKLLHLISLRWKKGTIVPGKQCLDSISLVQLLKVLLRQRFSSPLLSVTNPISRNHSPTEQESSLQPLNRESVLYLLAALQNLLIQKDLLLVQATVSCLESLLHFLYLKDINVAQHVALQPWNRFVLFTSLSSSERAFLQPGFLRFITVWLCFSATNHVSTNEIKQIIDEASKLILSELPTAAVQDLQIFLKQIKFYQK
ncbi:meiosis inhibitor 1 [Pelobates cultripes]|uniref:Meiosis inhibitor 1 n=1 Tax=Pelobates cultripes TaxID=61616 RepID=A0AAD1WLH1_PELCU|nr:meiosis inhibitor 1 [Pelobates cultripes]